MHVLQPFASKYVRFGRTVNTNMFNRPLRNRYRPLRPLALRLSRPLRGRLWRPGPPGPPAFSVFCFLPRVLTRELREDVFCAGKPQQGLRRRRLRNSSRDESKAVSNRAEGRNAPHRYQYVGSPETNEDRDRPPFAKGSQCAFCPQEILNTSTQVPVP